MTDSDDPKKNCYLTLHMGLGAGLITAIHVGGLYGRCVRLSRRLAALPPGRATARLARTVAWRGEATKVDGCAHGLWPQRTAQRLALWPLLRCKWIGR